MVIEVVLASLVFGLLAATTLAALIGLAGVFGVLRLVRCPQCRRLDMTSASDPARLCLSCRHDRLLHPLTSLHHDHHLRHPDHRHRVRREPLTHI